MIGLESIKDMHMIHCVCPNRTQQWLTAMCLPFSASSEGRIRNLGLGSKIGTFLGPFWDFGSILDQVLNLGPCWSPWFWRLESTYIPVPSCICGFLFSGVATSRLNFRGGFLSVGGIPILCELSLQTLLIDVASLRLKLNSCCFRFYSQRLFVPHGCNNVRTNRGHTFGHFIQ